MKKLYTLLILLIPFTGVAQFIGCNNGINFYPEEVFTPVENDWSAATTFSYAGEIIKINVTNNNFYTFRAGSTYNTTLTLTDENGNILALNDDWLDNDLLNFSQNYYGVELYQGSNDNSILFWQANFDGVVYLHLNEKLYEGGDDYNYCVSNETYTTVNIYRGIKYYCSTGSCNPGVPGVLEYFDYDFGLGGGINEFSTLEECQENCNTEQIWGCTYANGIDCIQNPTPGQAAFGIVYPSQAACFENCNLGWECNYGPNVFCYEPTSFFGQYITEEECIDDYCYEPTFVYSCIGNSCTEVVEEDFSGLTYSTLEECEQADCEFDWWCYEDGSCYEEFGGNGLFLSEENCLDSCNAQISYNCLEGSCYEVLGTNGSFFTLEQCQLYCEGGEITLYECDQNGCLDFNISKFDFSKFPEEYEFYFQSMDDCLNNCELPMVYYCDEQTGCYEDVIGLSDNYYNSINDCEIQCFTIPETYNCIGNACINPLDGSGTYSSLNDCVTNCDVLQSFDCINGDCIDPLDGTGEFSIFGQCFTSCISTDIEIINNNNFNVFPNPTNNNFNISFHLNNNHKVQITIINSLGQIIYNTEKAYNSGQVNEKIEFKEINKGIYFITLKSDELNQKIKLIIN